VLARRIHAVALLLVAVLVASPIADAATAQLQVPGGARGAPVKVLFLGDSLRGGRGATTGPQGFEPRIITELARFRSPRKLDPQPRTFAGVTTARSYAAIPRHADFAIVELGTNDFASRTVNQFRADYRALIRRVEATDAGRAIVCVSVWRPAGEARTRAFNAVIRAACPGTYVGISRHFDEAGTRGPAGRRTFLGAGDDFHPNDRGYKLIAHDVLAHLRF
jgi:acyl-CoA thioesterase I